MPVPSSLASLSTTPGSNSPGGGENPFPELDDHLRQSYAFHAQNRDAITAKLNSSAVSAYMLTVLDDANAGAARTTLGAVGNSGNETIAGVKTFSSAPVSSAAAAAANELMRKGEVDSAVASAAASKADLAGSASQAFSVAAATAAAHAVRLGQLIASTTASTVVFKIPCTGLPGGATQLVVQLGTATAPSNGEATFNFPEAFTNAVVVAFGNKIYRQVGAGDGNAAGMFPISLSQYKVFADDGGGDISWIAVGY